MNALASSALKLYGKVDVEVGVATADPHRLVAMLYDAAVASVAAALAHLAARRVAEKGMAIGKAIRILDEGLRPALDREAGGEIAQGLERLYAYIVNRLVVANATNDAAILSEVTELLTSLAESWRAIAAERPAPRGEGSVALGRNACLVTA